jgi:DNA (cytosine-5)-methyltransferase 1
MSSNHSSASNLANSVTLRFIDLFAGIGGIRRGFELAASAAGISTQCCYTAEINEPACAIYRKNFPDDDHDPLHDVTALFSLQAGEEQINDALNSKMGPVDVVLAGFPCQAFSIAGAKKGFEDTRGTLFFNVAKVIQNRLPAAFILENVKGLVIHRGGRTLSRIIEVLKDELGYASTCFKVLNSLDFGVPQHRERIYIVGFRSDIGGGFTFPKEVDSSKRIKDILESHPVASRYYLSEGYLAAARRHKERHAAKGNGFGLQIRAHSDYAGAIVCGGMGRERNLIVDTRIRDLTPETNIRSPINNERIRRMTPVEWERLQGFPDRWTDGVADTHRYRLLGNSVTVPVVRAVADRVLHEILNPTPFIPTTLRQPLLARW